MQPFSYDILRMEHGRLSLKAQQPQSQAGYQDLTLGMLWMMDSSNTASKPCRASRVETDHFDGGLSRNKDTVRDQECDPR